MANVIEVKLCPNCDQELPIPNIERCPSCKALLRSPENKYFTAPDYLTAQLSDYIHQVKEDLPNYLKSETEGKAYAKKTSDLHNNFYLWLKVIPEEDLIAGLRDSRLIMQNILTSNCSIGAIKAAVAHGKAVGKLAEAVDSYLNLGGQIINQDHIEIKFPETNSQEREGS